MIDRIVARLDLPGVAFLLPAAPGGSWYPERFTAPKVTNQPSLDHALAMLDDAVGTFGAAGLAPGRVVLVGFSQGACLVAEYVARRPARYGGVALLTGGLLGSDEEVAGPDGSLEGVPVAFVTSSLDTWVPIDRVRRSVEAFERSGAAVTLDVRDDPEHHIDDRALAAVRRLLLGAAPA